MWRTVLLLLLFIAGLAPAQAADEQALKARLAQAVGAMPDRLVPSPIPGIYEAEFGTHILYVTADGKFALAGDLIDLESGVNITEVQGRALVAALLKTIPASQMLVIGPKQPKRILTIFTDVDCPYCAQLDREVPTLNTYGVQVRYLLYPRAGVGSETYRREVAVWCAPDRAKALGIAIAGGAVPMKTCPNPVAQNYALGEKVGLTGTPTIFLPDGRRIGGYLPAAELLAVLGLTNARAPALP